MYLRNDRLPKTWLDQRLKCPVSVEPSKSIMVNALKHCSNLKDSSFNIFIDHCQVNYLIKSFC